METTSQPANSPFSIEAPTSLETQAMMKKLLGYRAEKLWRDACEACNVETDGLGIEELEKIADYLIKQGSLPGVIGNGLLVRIRIYRKAQQEDLRK